MIKTAIAKEETTLAEAVRTSAERVTLLQQAAPAIKRLAKMCKSKWTKGMYVSASSGWLNNVTLSVTLDQVPGFKSGIIPRMIERLDGFGEWKWDSSDYPEYFERTYRAAMVVEGYTLKVQLTCTVANDSKTCRRVVVGEKRSECVEPEYEMICE